MRQVAQSSIFQQHIENILNLEKQKNEGLRISLLFSRKQKTFTFKKLESEETTQID